LPQIPKEVLVYDCSGQGRHRENWKIFYPKIDALIFVIDATDDKRLYIAKELLDNTANDLGIYFSTLF